MLLCAPC